MSERKGGDEGVSDVKLSVMWCVSKHEGRECGDVK